MMDTFEKDSSNSFAFFQSEVENTKYKKPQSISTARACP